MLKFKQTSEESSDCSAHYEVSLDRTCTLQDFIDIVLKERNGEWGYFSIYETDKSWLDYDRYEYSHGCLKDNIPPEILNKTISHIKGHGGWTRMDYLIKFTI